MTRGFDSDEVFVCLRVSGSELVQKYIGEGSRMVSGVFGDIRRKRFMTVAVWCSGIFRVLGVRDLGLDSRHRLL